MRSTTISLRKRNPNCPRPPLRSWSLISLYLSFSFKIRLRWIRSVQWTHQSWRFIQPKEREIKVIPTRLEAAASAFNSAILAASLALVIDKDELPLIWDPLRLDRCDCLVEDLLSWSARKDLQEPIKGGNFGARLTNLCDLWLDVPLFSHLNKHRSRFLLDVSFFSRVKILAH